jgi:phosphomannomutase
MLIPTPIVSYVITHLPADGAINITASHNPKEDNGIKLYNATGAQVCDEIPDIEK